VPSFSGTARQSSLPLPQRVFQAGRIGKGRAGYLPRHLVELVVDAVEVVLQSIQAGLQPADKVADVAVGRENCLVDALLQMSKAWLKGCAECG